MQVLLTCLVARPLEYQIAHYCRVKFEILEAVRETLSMMLLSDS